MDMKIGLSTKEALAKLCEILESEIDKERELAAKSFTFRFLAHDEVSTGSFCIIYAIASVICCLVLLTCSLLRGYTIFDQFASVMFLVITISNIFHSSKVNRNQRFAVVARALNILDTLKSLKEENFEYEHLYTPSSDAMNLQWTYRDHKLVNVPWMLLVNGDIIELRGGQSPPCRCMSQHGDIIDLGDKLQSLEILCPETHGILPSKSTLWEVVEPPVVEHIRSAFRNHRKKHSNLLNCEIDVTLHFIIERCLLPFIFTITFILHCFRKNPQILLGIARECVVCFLVDTSLILLPLLGPMVPIFCLVGKNLGFVLGNDRNLQYSKSSSGAVASRIFVDRSKKRTVINGFKTVYHYFTGHFHASLDFVFTCGGLTSCAFLDKKGLLSWPNATIEKVLCFHSDGEGKDRKLMPKILDLTMNGAEFFPVHFDDSSWECYKRSILPFGISSILNGCSLLPDYTLFLNHISSISENMSSTIAVSNRHCLCPLTQLLGIGNEVLDKFDISNTKTIGFYKRLQRKGSDNELRKFRMPLENAFLTITKDTTSKYYHVMSQGTADLLLNACTHIWCENSLEPYTPNLHKQVLDFYQRNTMTGFCLVLGYRTLGCTISDTLSGRYIDVSLLEKCELKERTSIPRTVSLDMEFLKAFYRQSPLHTAYECFEEVMRGQTLCGLLVLQHQARSDVVQLVEQLDHACIRFIYFSKENELRSRVFAEKLGLEAGWNCHISLASEDEQSEVLDVGKYSYQRPTELALHRSATWSEHFPLYQSRSSIISIREIFCKFQIETNTVHVHRRLYLRKYRQDRSEVSLKKAQSHHSVYSYGGETGPELFPNKAKLPSGIRNIRPHLKNVDNVPLLVNLFTDCDHFSCQRMIEIMQDFGEVVLVVGSSLNYFNGSIFNQGNCSIAIEPQHPALCSRKIPESNEGLKKASVIATLIMGLCCDIVVFPSQTIDLISLISSCRYQLGTFRSSFIFFISSSIALTLQQTFTLLFLPNLLSVFQVFLFIVIYVPLLSLSLMASSHDFDENRDEIAPKNNPSAAKRLIRRALIYSSINFLSSLLVVYLIYYNIVVITGTNYELQGNFNFSSYPTSRTIIISQHVASFYLLLYLCILSMSFVHFRDNCWTRCPLTNYYWVSTTCCVIFVQIVYTYLSCGSLLIYISECNVWITVISFLWIIAIIIISELYKLRFIKLHHRDQRRRKLSFNTKLGMNSPY
uniref:Transmembrane protein 94 n=1 Tax=Elaeophora elaphi TaxID=1147741 RepID=A0A0R3RQK5_9BILA